MHIFSATHIDLTSVDANLAPLASSSRAADPHMATAADTAVAVEAATVARTAILVAEVDTVAVDMVEEADTAVVLVALVAATA